MALTPMARTAFALTGALTRIGLMPTPERVMRQPLAKRLAGAPPKGLLGVVADAVVTDHEVMTRDGDRIRARLYRPNGTSGTSPLLYLHGGGFVVGGLASCDHICRRLAGDADAAVLSVEYRLAPEHRFPGPLHDAYDALQWLRASAAELGVDMDRLVLAGDSAGGNLAAALALMCRDGGEHLAGQLLLYPALDLTVGTATRAGYRGVGLTTDQCRLCADAYLGDHDPRDPLASPLLAADLAGLPPALVVTVQHDPLRAEGGDYVRRLAAAGVPARLLDLPDHVHGSLSLPRLYRGIDQLYADVAAFIKAPADTVRAAAA